MGIARIKTIHFNENNSSWVFFPLNDIQISFPLHLEAIFFCFTTTSQWNPVVVFCFLFLPPVGQFHLLDVNLARRFIPTHTLGRVAQLQQSLEQRGRNFLGHGSAVPSKQKHLRSVRKRMRANDEHRRLLRLINTRRWAASPCVTSRRPGANQRDAFIWFKRGGTPIRKSESRSRTGDGGDSVIWPPDTRINRFTHWSRLFAIHCVLWL